MKTFWQRLRQPWRSADARAIVQEDGGVDSLHWILPNQLAVGPIPQAQDLDRFQAQGIRAILSLCDSSEAIVPPVFTNNFHCAQFILPDSRKSDPLLPSKLAEAVDLLADILKQQGPTYVHCLAGVERSPTVCVAYLCRYHRLQIWEALNWVKGIHSRTGITSDQLRVIADCIKI